VGGLQHVYEGNETYTADDGKCSLPDGLSIIMEKKAVTEITYKTVVKSTYTDIVNYFVKYGFRTILTETEEDPETKKDVVFTTMESNEVTAYRIVTGTETKVVDGKNCTMYTITIGFTY
jgi:methionine synthase I (cobalamin-dependent)